jgi:Ca2+-binding EF-hand superfamily protein
VSKAEVFRFLEMQFARADKNHDGLIDVEELEMFVRSIAHPAADLR